MAMTKKHYEAIAGAILAERNEWRDQNLEVQFGAISAINEVSEKLADYFYADNPNFDPDRFLSACGVEVTE